ncbi:MAG: 1-acyl-sn-glycerol-3-phosphate acyltransferase [Acidobacteria bacterium]|nr:1-acyl-sn-glycerol-3-phosphate acyltransferase [Acidobacteriota bacterium]
MLRLFRLSAIMVTCLFFILVVLISQPFLFFITVKSRVKLLTSASSIWARILLKVLGISVRSIGILPDSSRESFLLVSNHQSYLDILIILSLFPAAFIAKSEVGSWPLIGWLSRLAPTVFIRRGDTLSNVQGFYGACGLLRQGINVQVFPEGTTSDGTEVLKFSELFLASAVRTGRRVLPLTVNFQMVNGVSPDRDALDLICWYGEMDFASHFWKLLAIDSAEVSLVVQKPISIEKYSRAASVARVAEVIVKSEFDSHLSESIAAARAEVPMELMTASTAGHPSHDEVEPISDFVLGAILYALLASNLNENVYDMIPQQNEA